jgi:dUTP pyrophosphatase
MTIAMWIDIILNFLVVYWVAYYVYRECRLNKKLKLFEWYMSFQMTPIIGFKRLVDYAKIPAAKHKTDSGMDIAVIECVTIPPGEYRNVRTGIAAQIPPQFELQVRPRSSLASKNGVVAAFGTVDEGYRGEIRVTLYNYGVSSYTVCAGDRVAQLVLCPVSRPEIVEITELSKDTDRGDNGFGSTGK